MHLNKVKIKIKSILMSNKSFMLKKTPAFKIDTYKIIYIPIPKVACSSITSICVDLLGFNLPNNKWKAHVFRNNKLDNLIDIKKRDNAKISCFKTLNYTDYWRFAVTRNPYDRLVSCYSEKICKNIGFTDSFKNGLSNIFDPYDNFYGHMPFDEFVTAICNIPDNQSDPHFRSQYTFITNRHNEIFVDFICDIQNISSLETELKKRTKQIISIPHLLKSNHKNYKKYFNHKLRELVYKRYEKDFKLLNYKKYE